MTYGKLLRSAGPLDRSLVSRLAIRQGASINTPTRKGSPDVLGVG